MFNSSVIDTFISLGMIYLSLSLVCSGLNEWLAALLQRRPKVLKDSIKHLIGSYLTTKLYQDPVIQSLRTPIIIPLSKNGDRLRDPSYIPDRTFVLALLRCLGVMPQQNKIFMPTDFNIIYEKIGDVQLNGLTSTGIKPTEPQILQIKNTATQILDVLDDVTATTTYNRSACTFDAPSPLATTSLSATISSEDAKLKLDKWFHDAMDRASGWYKRRTLINLFLWAGVVSIACNADTFKMARVIWHGSNNNMRTALVNAALNIANASATAPVNINIAPGLSGSRSRTSSDGVNRPSQLELDKEITGQINQNFQGLEKPLGWEHIELDPRKWEPKQWNVGWKLAGFLITTVALSLGAPFWFDLLSRIVNLRSTGKPLPGSGNKPNAPTKSQ